MRASLHAIGRERGAVSDPVQPMSEDQGGLILDAIRALRGDVGRVDASLKDLRTDVFKEIGAVSQRVRVLEMADAVDDAVERERLERRRGLTLSRRWVVGVVVSIGVGVVGAVVQIGHILWGWH